jgi:ankyrin repeat protein
MAAKSGHETMARALVRLGADVNARDDARRTVLPMAAENGHEAVVKLLLATDGIDLELQGHLGQDIAVGGPENGREAVVKLLLATDGIDPNSKDTRWDWTPLSWTARNGHKAVVKLLLAMDGVDPNAKDATDRTLLSWVAENGHKAAVKLLLVTDGVDPNADTWGWAVLSRAAENGHEAVKLLLATDGIDPNLDGRRCRGRRRTDRRRRSSCYLPRTASAQTPRTPAV